jgi:hypothetical protein
MFYYNRSGLVPQSGQTYVADNELMTLEPPGQFPPFLHYTTRAPKDAVNPYLIVLNAAAKFVRHEETYGWEGVSERARQLVKKTLHVVELIYFEPVESHSTASGGPSRFAIAASGDQGQSYNPSASAFQQDDTSGSHADEDSLLMEDNIHQMVDDNDEIALSSDEIDEVFNKLHDSTIPAMERFRLSSLLLFPNCE